MLADDPSFEDSDPHVHEDLRQQISGILLERADMIAADAASLFPFSGDNTLDPDYSRRIGHLLLQLLAIAIRDGRVDARGGFVADLYRVSLERSVTTAQLFTFAYLVERMTLDEIAISDVIGATSEPWPAVAQLVRRASFDLLAAYTSRTQLEPTKASIIDSLTTAYTRPLFEAVLAKEAERAGRYGYSISVIVFDVDRLSAINARHGYGVGDKVLERIGILIRKYFRQHDWVARYGEDAFAVLLTRADPNDAADLAEHVRQTVEERLGFRDHRTDDAVAVTVTAAVVNVPVSAGDVIDPERLMIDAEGAIDRAKRLGPNHVERVDGYSGGVVRAKG